MRVLVIEDDEGLADVLGRGLVDAGHEARVCRTGPDGLEAALAGPYDAVILDWMLPGRNGPSVCRKLRARGDETPVLMLTARHAVAERVGGLTRAPTTTCPSRSPSTSCWPGCASFARRLGDDELLTVDDLAVDRSRRVVTRGDVEVELTAREFDVLALLVRRAGHVVSRLAILDEVWDGEADLRSNAIDVHVAKLRAKIDRPFGRDSIRTVRGVGFRLDRGA